MINADNFNAFYEQDFNLFPESAVWRAFKRQKEWDNLSDDEKLSQRKNKFEYYKYHFNELPENILEREYEAYVIEITEIIVSFLNNFNVPIDLLKNTIDYHFYRIYILLYCEKEAINRPISYKQIHHTPYIFFEEIIQEISHTKEFTEYKLDKLFGKYQKMLSLQDKVCKP